MIPIFIIISLILLFVFLILGTNLLLKKNNHHRLINTIFASIILILHTCDIIFSAIEGNGLNLKNVTPISNISPFIFTIIALTIFLPCRINKYIYKYIAIFQWALFIAAFYVPIAALIKQDSTYFSFAIFDSVAHIVTAAFCYYLRKTKQVDVSFKEFGYISLITSSLVVVVIIINLICHTNFFGLNFYGNHNIYGSVIVEDGFLSAFIYLSGLALALWSGYFLYLKTTFLYIEK